MGLRHTINNEPITQIQEDFIKTCFLNDEIKEMLEILVLKDIIYKEEILGILRFLQPKILNLLKKILEKYKIANNLLAVVSESPKFFEAFKGLS